MIPLDNNPRNLSVKSKTFCKQVDPKHLPKASP